MISREPFDPGDSTAISSAADWAAQLLTGSLAIALCVIAIAVLGMLMLSGRLPLRTGLRTVLGCFILLGAPTVASGFLRYGESGGEPGIAPAQNAAQPRPDLPPAAYDPYAGASLRQD